VSQKKRDIFDDIVEGVRRIMEDIERALNPDKKKAPVPVPVPVHPDRRIPQEYSQR